MCSAQNAYNIAGHVVSHSDQQPIKGARVSIAMSKEASHEVSVISGENGEFAFNSIPADKYQLRVTHSGVSRLYRQTDNYSTAIVTGPDRDTEHIVFTFELATSIAGKVVDDDNDPAPNMQVYLFRQALVAGKQQTSMRASNSTNSSGTFHFRNLEPGTYYLAVIGRPWYAQPSVGPVNNPALDLAYPATYYSGATNVEGATPLKLVEGQRADIQISLHAVPALHIKMNGWDSGRRGRGGIMLTQSGPGGTLIHLPIEIANTEIVGIAPGPYTLTAGGSRQTVNFAGDSEVQVDSSVETSLKGTVAFGGEAAARPTLLLRDEATGQGASQPIKADGTFDFPNIQPGHYGLVLMNAKDQYLTKVEARGATYVNGVLDVAAGAHVELRLATGRGLAKVSGVVILDGKPLAAAMVLLIPKDANSGQRFGRDQSDSDGTFTMAGIIPGRYTLVAIDDGHDFAYADSAVIAPYLQRGQVVDIPLKEDAKVEVQQRLR